VVNAGILNSREKAQRAQKIKKKKTDQIFRLHFGSGRKTRNIVRANNEETIRRGVVHPAFDQPLVHCAGRGEN
jgi:hypothetical protein